MSIIHKPIVTEKMTEKGEGLGQYGFVVEKSATKLQIKSAIESLYNVNVESVNTLIYGPKVKSRFTKSGVITGKTKAVKKAIVTLKKGDVIDFYSNI
jgi:large subunit ribosomal protein L23